MDTVKRAAALLDRAKPGWENLIDTEVLTLDGPGCETDCVLGQVYGNFWEGCSEFFRTFPDFDVDDFSDPFNENGTGEHTQRWLEEIHDRRSHIHPDQQVFDLTERVSA